MNSPAMRHLRIRLPKAYLAKLITADMTAQNFSIPDGAWWFWAEGSDDIFILMPAEARA
jgi:hypothetical protein